MATIEHASQAAANRERPHQRLEELDIEELAGSGVIQGAERLMMALTMLLLLDLPMPGSKPRVAVWGVGLLDLAHLAIWPSGPEPAGIRPDPAGIRPESGPIWPSGPYGPDGFQLHRELTKQNNPDCFV